MSQTALAGLGLALPWVSGASAQPALKPTLKVPSIRFRPSTKGEGTIGPYGEVRIFKVGSEVLPVFASAIDGSAVMDLTGRSAFVRYGKVPNAITLTSAGVKFGSAKAQKWSADIVRELIAAIVKDSVKTRGAMLLRSALYSSYPVAFARSKSPEGKSMGAIITKGAIGYGSGAMSCTTTTTTETVYTTITETVAVMKTASGQLQECYDREAHRNPCRAWGDAAGLCAATVCGTKAFTDICTGFTQIVTEIAQEVTREVVSCVAPLRGQWPNPWIPPGMTRFPPGVTLASPQPTAAFAKKDIDAALKFLKHCGILGGACGDFAKCFLEGEWSLAQLDTHLNLNGTGVVIPYGVRVCLTAECATELSSPETFAQEGGSWIESLRVLAALNPDFAALVAPAGITPEGIVVALVAALGSGAPIIVSAAEIILGVILLVLLYGAAISAQLFFHRTCTDNFADGRVCIEHPSFALALITIATFGFGSFVNMIPPIVTG